MMGEHGLAWVSSSDIIHAHVPPHHLPHKFPQNDYTKDGPLWQCRRAKRAAAALQANAAAAEEASENDKEVTGNLVGNKETTDEAVADVNEIESIANAKT